MMTKPRVVKDYDKLPVEIQEQMARKYPMGFQKHLIKFTNKEGKLISALAFETAEKSYLVRMSNKEAIDIHNRSLVLDDEDQIPELDEMPTDMEPAFVDELEEEE